jgi:glyoxylase-like metal-dependent hydrolase (beta-lactamase superfamily II)
MFPADQESPMTYRPLVATLTLFALGLAGCAPAPEEAPAAEPTPAEEAAPAPTVSVEEIADGVHRFAYNNHRSLFIVTDDGVLATDPQSTAAAERYLEEIRRITDAPIQYLVYSHHHGDHASGGAVFGDDVTVVSHENVVGHLDEPGMEDVRAPDETFADEMTLTIGDVDVELAHLGHSETDSNLILHVPSRRLAFVVDTYLVSELPWRNMASGDLDGWLAALQTIAEYDVDQIVPGHGDEVGTTEHARELIEYLETLKAAVAERMADGQSLEEIQASLTLPEYAGWVRYDEHFGLNIEGVHRELSEQAQ